MLEGKVAVVTGASRGIGKAIALTLAGYGAAVVVNYNGSKEKANEVVKAIEEMGQKAIAVKASVSDSAEVAQLMEKTIETFGKIDILVNNAGITKDNLVMRMSKEDFDSVIDTNLKGTFLCMKQVYKLMLKQRSGRIINLSSVTGIVGNAGQVNYAASKAGVIGMTKSLARELGSRGITVNAVAPGFIETEMTDVLSDTVKKEMEGRIPLKRMGHVQDVAETVAFLASEKAAYITGQVIQVDGGMAM